MSRPPTRWSQNADGLSSRCRRASRRGRRRATRLREGAAVREQIDDEEPADDGRDERDEREAEAAQVGQGREEDQDSRARRDHDQRPKSPKRAVRPAPPREDHRDEDRPGDHRGEAKMPAAIGRPRTRSASAIAYRITRIRNDQAEPCAGASVLRREVGQGPDSAAEDGQPARVDEEGRRRPDGLGLGHGGIVLPRPDGAPAAPAGRSKPRAGEPSRRAARVATAPTRRTPRPARTSRARRPLRGALRAPKTG